jgi:Tat protein secretion system quality control protein TatD with DNase activity
MTSQPTSSGSRFFTTRAIGLGKRVLSGQMDEVLRAMPLDKILLESDAPYQLEHPWQMTSVAEYVGNAKHLPLALICELAGMNAGRFFHI